MSAPEFWDEAKAHLSKRDKKLAKVIGAYKGEMMMKRGDAFGTLARAIVGQQISTKAADSVWKKFSAAVGKVTAKNVAIADVPSLRACGLSGSKVIYLHALAEHFLTQQKMIKRWPEMDDDAIIKELTSIKGIGRWTAEMFLIFYLGRPDVLPLGDLGLLKGIYRVHNKGEKLEKAQILAISEKWKPYRSVATWYLWRALDPVPIAY